MFTRLTKEQKIAVFKWFWKAESVKFVQTPNTDTRKVYVSINCDLWAFRRPVVTVMTIDIAGDCKELVAFRSSEDGFISKRSTDTDYTYLKRPSFVASSQNLSVPEGSDVSFPCDYDFKDTQENLYMMIFKYISPKDEDRIYYAGETKVTHFPRIKKEGPSFILSDVKPSDGGKYVCRFETKPLTQVVHRLEVLYPSKIWRESPELQRVPQKSNVLLQCSAEGNPQPTITWKRQGGLLPSGAQTEEGFSITLEKVNRHVEGTYTCSATNGIGTPVSASMTVQVEYPPEIISEQSIIHTGEGNDAKLVCVVHGRPSPEVKWLRGGVLVTPGQHIMTHDGAHRHTLTIKRVTEENFGDYICKAFNNLNTTTNVFTVTGLPRKPQITSKANGTHKTSYTLVWATETSSPLVQYRLRYRKISDEADDDWKESVYFPNDQNITQVRQGVYEIKHVLKHIRPGEIFEATVEVENKFGWSRQSDIFKFQSKKEVITKKYGKYVDNPAEDLEDPTTTTTTVAPPPPQTFSHGPKVGEVAVGQSTSGVGKEYQINISSIVSLLCSLLMFPEV